MIHISKVLKKLNFIMTLLSRYVNFVVFLCDRSAEVVVSMQNFIFHILYNGSR